MSDIYTLTNGEQSYEFTRAELKTIIMACHLANHAAWEMADEDEPRYMYYNDNGNTVQFNHEVCVTVEALMDRLESIRKPEA